MDSGRTRRNSINPIKVRAGKQWVLNQLNNVASRCNSKMTTNGYEGEEVDYMDCKAKVYEGSDDPVSEGSYNSARATHAEINALGEYILQETDFTTVSKIEISAPPCKSCAFVLELLGVINTVHTTKNIYKHATSAWRWHDNLKNIDSFDTARWATIRNNFAGSGLSDSQILNIVIEIVETRPQVIG